MLGIQQTSLKHVFSAEEFYSFFFVITILELSFNQTQPEKQTLLIVLEYTVVQHDLKFQQQETTVSCCFLKGEALTYIYTLYIYITCLLTKPVNLQELYKEYLNLDGHKKFICQKY